MFNPCFCCPKEFEILLNSVIDMQFNCMMGVFPEISRAWLTIDNDIFMWNYEDGYVPINIIHLNVSLVFSILSRSGLGISWS